MENTIRQIFVTKLFINLRQGKGNCTTCTWQLWSSEDREKNVIAIEEKKTKLAQSNLSQKQQHDKLLQYLRENGIRTLGKPRITSLPTC